MVVNSKDIYLYFLGVILYLMIYKSSDIVMISSDINEVIINRYHASSLYY